MIVASLLLAVLPLYSIFFLVPGSPAYFVMVVLAGALVNAGMPMLIVTATKIIHAPAGQIYNIIADYRDGHTNILPKSYFPLLEVEEGGFGEATVIR